MEKSPVGSFPFKPLRFYFSLESMLMGEQGHNSKGRWAIFNNFPENFHENEIKTTGGTRKGVALADPGGGSSHASFSVQYLSFSCSFRGEYGQIVG